MTLTFPKQEIWWEIWNLKMLCKGVEWKQFLVNWIDDHSPTFFMGIERLVTSTPSHPGLGSMQPGGGDRPLSLKWLILNNSSMLIRTTLALNINLMGIDREVTSHLPILPWGQPGQGGGSHLPQTLTLKPSPHWHNLNNFLIMIDS